MHKSPAERVPAPTIDFAEIDSDTSNDGVGVSSTDDELGDIPERD